MSTTFDIPFFYQPREGLMCTGQPDADAFRAVAAQGVSAVVNLRPDEEMDWDEAALLESLGLEYLHIPVASTADLNQDNATKLTEWLVDREDKSVLVHCASSNRVGALLALGAFQAGLPPEDAMALGRAAGLTRMEPVVQQLMAQWAA